MNDDTGPLVNEVHDLFASSGVVASVVAGETDEDRFIVELCRPDGTVVWPRFAGGSDELHALLAAEQRYLVEETGEDPAPGQTWADKAAARLRQWIDAQESGTA